MRKALEIILIVTIVAFAGYFLAGCLSDDCAKENCKCEPCQTPCEEACE
jgi:hypothetical protein